MAKRVLVVGDTPDDDDNATAAANIALRALRDLYDHKYDSQGGLITNESSDAVKLRWLAQWLDSIDRRVGEYTETRPRDDMQNTLRAIADRIDQQ